ncbi:CaiB/BaiF CoA transferase family protein [Achromobacter insolitus]|uniref:CaiB/BaiF CoA transferase family protein n=1 Tax=Achromobacter insolitus TaxID=217204 RepID=UPI0027DFE75D|nr:CaiB/BaiF CoA-transferase family protein [Achromobacter insolitus]MDQ6215953.1 CoA transferase [Achromobacter insolitus]
MGALSHLRVLDLSRVLAGPWASQLLADLGAEVIKIERPGLGDDTRGWGPPWISDPQWGDVAQSAYFAGANRNKKSVAIDIAMPEGRRLVAALAAQCDVFIENFKVGGLRAYGLDYDTLKRQHPGLVYCSITGFGQSGPYASRPGYDFLVQGMGGLMSITGREDGQPGAGPLKVGVALTDILTGLYATAGIQAALAHRDRTGEGQHVDVALLDVQVAVLANQAMNFLASGREPARLGNAHPNIVPYQDFATRDGYVIVTVGNDTQFRKFCGALGLPDLADDPRYVNNTARLASRGTLIPLIQERMALHPSAHWLRELEALGVPCGPINGLAEVFADPQVLQRGMRVPMPNAQAGCADLVGNPLHLSATPVEYRSAPPVLGSHTEPVLREVLGLAPQALADLRRDGAIAVEP